MVLSASEAGARYEAGVDALGGASEWYRCGDMKGGGFLKVSDCLHNLKRAKGTTASWRSRYEAAA